MSGITIFTTLPFASRKGELLLRMLLTGAHSKYPRGFDSSGGRRPSVNRVSPPACSICIMSDVPERGKPVTITVVFVFNVGLRRNADKLTFSSLIYNLACNLRPKPASMPVIVGCAVAAHNMLYSKKCLKFPNFGLLQWLLKTAAGRLISIQVCLDLTSNEGLK